MRVLCKGKGLEIREYPPRKRNIQVYFGSRIRRSTEEESRYEWVKLQFPYMLFAQLVSTDSDSPKHNSYLCLVFSPDPIYFWEQKVYSTPLPNCYFNHANTICLGNCFDGTATLDGLIDCFWQTTFTGTSGDGRIFLDRMGGIEAWEKMSLLDVRKELSEKWQSHFASTEYCGHPDYAAQQTFRQWFDELTSWRLRPLGDRQELFELCEQGLKNGNGAKIRRPS